MREIIELVLDIFAPKKEIPKISNQDYTPEHSNKFTMMSHEFEAKKAKEEPKIKPIEFKRARQKKEFELLKGENAPLVELLEDLNQYSQKEFKKSILITMIFRTQEEQDYFYRNSKKYAIRKFKSPHQFWQAVDLRSSDFTEKEIKQLVEYVNSKWNSDNYWDWTAKYHTVGAGLHFHIQFLKD